MSEYDYMMKCRCPECGVIFEVPYSDRVDALLFGNWRKYHPTCKEADVAKKLLDYQEDE